MLSKLPHQSHGRSLTPQPNESQFSLKFFSYFSKVAIVIMMSTLNFFSNLHLGLKVNHIARSKTPGHEIYYRDSHIHLQIALLVAGPPLQISLPVHACTFVPFFNCFHLSKSGITMPLPQTNSVGDRTPPQVLSRQPQQFL